MGGQQAVSRHRASGRLPVREQVALLFDEGSWYQAGVLAQPERRTEKKVPGDRVVTGFGRTVGLIGGDRVFLVLQSANRERTRSPTWRPNIAARAVTGLRISYE